MIGENGIINRSKQGGEEYTKASLKEELQLKITEIEMSKLQNGEQIQREDLQELSKAGAIILDTGIPTLGEYEDYNFEIDENYQVTIKEKLQGNKPKLQIELITKQLALKVQIKVTASVEGSTIETIEAPSDAVLVQEISNTERIYEVAENKRYHFLAKATNGRRGSTDFTIKNVAVKPRLELVEKTNTTMTVKITNAPQEAGLMYKYYLDNVETISNTTDVQVTFDNIDSNLGYVVYVTTEFEGRILRSEAIAVVPDTYLNPPIISLSANNLKVAPLEYPVLTTGGMMNCALTIPTVGQEVSVKITNTNHRWRNLL